MKKLTAMALIAAAFALASPQSASAHDYQRGDSGNPMRYLAYPIHAFGTGLEWAFTRPIHWFVSLPNNRILFGHPVGVVADRQGREEVYFKWEEYR